MVRIINVIICILLFTFLFDCKNSTEFENKNNSDNLPVWSPEGNKIFFISDRSGKKHIYSMNSDGKHVLDITKSLPNIFVFAVSPDGNKIVFKTNEAEYSNLYVCNTDGTDPTIILEDFSIERYLQWSPDGSQIIFSTYNTIYTINSDGSGKKELTEGISPSWSPDGNRIAFVNNYDVFLINKDSTNMTRLTFDKNKDVIPVSWSSDGQFLAASTFTGKIKIINLYDNNQSFSFGENELYLYPKWSPTNALILFTANQNIYTSDINGQNIQNLTALSSRNISPSWSYDGQRIAFVSTRDGNEEIYVMNADGSNQRRLTNN